MSLIKKAFEVIQRLSLESGNKLTVSSKFFPKKEKSLLSKAKTLSSFSALPITDDIDEEDIKPIQTKETIPFSDIEEDDNNDFLTTDTYPLTNKPFFDEPLPEKEFNEKFLSTDNEEVIEVDEVIDLYEDYSPFLSYQENVLPRNDYLTEEFLGSRETIQITDEGLQNQVDNPEVEDVLTPQDTIDIGNENLDDWERTALKEAENDPFLSVEDSIIQEISNEGPLTDDIITDSLEKQIVDTKEKIADEITSNSEKKALETRLENYLVLVDITKELVKSNTFIDFFDSLIYSIEGQIGAESVLIFSSRNGNYDELELVNYDGLDVEPDFMISSNDEIYKTLALLDEATVASKISQQNLSLNDKLILEHPSTEVIVPIHVENDFVGFFVIGKNMSGSEYSNQDFEFLTLLADVTGSLILKLSEILRVNSELEELNESVRFKDAFTSLADSIYNCNDFSNLDKILTEKLYADFDVNKYSLAILSAEEKAYCIINSNFLSLDTISKLKIPASSKLVALVSQVSGYYKIENKEPYPELKSSLSPEELQSDFVLFPIIHLGKLFGILFIHEIDSPTWSNLLKQSLSSVANIIAPVAANLILQTERDFFFMHPFNPVDETISREIAFSVENKTKFTLIILKIQNVTRILNMLGNEFFTEYSEFITSKLMSNLEKDDYLSRVGQGKYGIFLRGKDKVQAESYFSWIKQEFGKFPYPPKEFKLSIQLYSLTFPDQSQDKRKYIELIEDT